jgi:hypothetical protein
MGRPWARGLAGLRDSFEVFWVGGLGLLLLELGSRVLAVRGERYEWSQYLGLGTVFPACILILAVAGRLGRLVDSVASAVRLGLAGYGLAVGLWFVFRHATATTVALATANWLILLAFAVRPSRLGAPREGEATGLAGHLATLFASVVAWVVVSRLCFWTPFESLAMGSARACLTSIAAMALVSAAYGRRGTPRAEGRIPIDALADLVAVLVLVSAGFRIDGLGAQDRSPDAVGLGRFAFYHWGPIVGPAELVRQGGWLLWDVPCQYGFLNTLLVAALPVGNAWQSFYLVNAVLTGASGLILYGILRSVRGGRWTPWVSLLVAASAIYLVTGDLRLSTGPSIGPSLGAYRFFWCFALLGILAWDFRARPDGPPRRKALLLGSVAWLLGTLWSSESATYCAAIWLPAYAWMVLELAWSRGRGLPRVRSLAWLALPGALLASALGILAAVYVRGLGHPPDWRAFADYSFANIERQGEPIDLGGAVWLPLLVLCTLATLVACLLSSGRSRGVALVAGAGGAVWAASSYFVARSDPGLLVNLSPVFCAALASALAVIARREADGAWPAILRAACLPPLVILPVLGLAYPRHLPDWLGSMTRGYTRRVDRLIPAMAPELAALLDRAGVGPEEPICYIDDSFQLNAIPLRPGPGGPAWTARAWLPTLPFSLFVPLPEERRWVYLARFSERRAMGGWLVEPNTLGGPSPALHWFYRAVGATHYPAKAYESPRWKVTRYERVVMAGRGGDERR